MRRVVLALFVALITATPALAAKIAIRIDQGVLNGDTEDGVQVFRGIPFAAPEHLYVVFGLAIQDALIDPDRDFGSERRRGGNEGNKKGEHNAAHDDHSG